VIGNYSVAESIANCAVKASYEVNAKLIIVFTNTGQAALRVRKFGPKCPILAVSGSINKFGSMLCAVARGIYHHQVGSLIGCDKLIDSTLKIEAIERGFVKKGDYIVATMGIEEGLQGSATSNLLKILVV
jgi:pyruvate kinase